ncbi:acetate--CoA ligase family protein [Dactylosporangium sp. CA-233914]|uniref:acetate--CoA ligase family protein n=1 Tax=Dactylosporangium sp. CA-233914 TaxID=3239934 RepID=UPI003D942E76
MALIGASPRSRFSQRVIRTSTRFGVMSDVVLVNPRGGEIDGHPVARSISEVNETIDAAVLAVPNAATSAVIDECLDVGVSHFVVHSSWFERRDHPRTVEMRERLNSRGATLIGPNCMGWVNLNDRRCLYGGHIPASIRPGGVSLVAQSGGAAIAFLNSAYGTGVDCMISTGNEMVTTLEDCLAVLIDRLETTTIALFIEELRQPDRFVELARRAADVGKPIVALKSGKSSVGSKVSQGHTGALTGEARAYSAAFRAAGVMEANTFEEMFALLALAEGTQTRHAKGGRTIIFGISGGELSHVADLAEAADVVSADLDETTAKDIANVLGLAGGNTPIGVIDVGAGMPAGGHDFAVQFNDVMRVIENDANVDLVVLSSNLASTFDPEQIGVYREMYEAAANVMGSYLKPAVVLSPPAAPVHEDVLSRLTEHGIPALRSAPDALRALAKYRRGADSASAHRGGNPSRPENPERGTWVRDALREGVDLGEFELKNLLEAYGIQRPREVLVSTPAQAVEAADRIGYPVVAKLHAAGVLHKTELGGVKLGLHSTTAVSEAASSILSRAMEQVPDAECQLLIAEQVGGVRELIVGAKLDRGFGPMVLVGAGGVDAEAMNTFDVALAPRTFDEAMHIVCTSAIARLILHRGSGDIESLRGLAEVVLGLAEILNDSDGGIEEIEINPLLMRSDESARFCALDAAAVLRSSRSMQTELASNRDQVIAARDQRGGAANNDL